MKVGTYSIPRFRLYPMLVEDTRKIYEKFSGEETETQYIAHLLGQSPKSGSFLQKLADLRAYGLIEGRGKVKVSETGKKLTCGIDEAERMEALEAVIKNIPLWGIFLDKLGVNLEESNFWVDLARTTGLEAPEAQKKADSVRKAYMADITYLKTVEKPIETSVYTSQQGEAIGRSDVGMETVGVTPQVPTSMEELKGKGVHIWLPRDNIQSAIKTAKKLLALYEEEDEEPEESD